MWGRSLSLIPYAFSQIGPENRIRRVGAGGEALFVKFGNGEQVRTP